MFYLKYYKNELRKDMEWRFDKGKITDDDLWRELYRLFDYEPFYTNLVNEKRNVTIKESIKLRENEIKNEDAL